MGVSKDRFITVLIHVSIFFPTKLKIYLKLFHHTSAYWIVHGFHTSLELFETSEDQRKLKKTWKTTSGFCPLKRIRISASWFQFKHSWQWSILPHLSIPILYRKLYSINYITINLRFHTSTRTVLLCFTFFFQNHWWANRHFLPIKNHEKLVAQVSICPFGNEEQTCCRSAVLILHANRTGCSCCQK